MGAMFGLQTQSRRFREIIIRIYNRSWGDAQSVTATMHTAARPNSERRENSKNQSLGILEKTLYAFLLTTYAVIFTQLFP